MIADAEVGLGVAIRLGADLVGVIFAGTGGGGGAGCATCAGGWVTKLTIIVEPIDVTTGGSDCSQNHPNNPICDAATNITVARRPATGGSCR